MTSKESIPLIGKADNVMKIVVLAAIIIMAIVWIFTAK